MAPAARRTKNEKLNSPPDQHRILPTLVLTPFRVPSAKKIIFGQLDLILKFSIFRIYSILSDFRTFLSNFAEGGEFFGIFFYFFKILYPQTKI